MVDGQPGRGAIAYVHAARRNEDCRRDDFYPTPPAGTRALLAVERFDGPIWEPACGDGSMAKVLEAAGHEVIATDLVNRGFGAPQIDFLMEWQSLAPNIVTNPPFKLAEQFVNRALALTSGKVAILARLAWLEGRQRRAFFEATPLARVWVFSGRLHMTKGEVPGVRGAGGMIAFAWFVWQHGFAGRPQLGWISPDDQ
jgi:hypothetical protein